MDFEGLSGFLYEEKSDGDVKNYEVADFNFLDFFLTERLNLLIISIKIYETFS